MFRLLSLENRGEVDNVVWGPYNTTIREYIGDMLGVVSNEDYTIGLFAGNDNTITGVPTDGDWNQMYYYVHTTDPMKYPLPDSLSEGQKFRIGGDGRNDVAFTDKPRSIFICVQEMEPDMIRNMVLILSCIRVIGGNHRRSFLH